MYKIFAFDGLALPEYVDDGGADNLGTGAALSSFVQLPGGYFDNYGERRAPQGIRPITKTCVLYGSTQETLKNNLFSLREKLGKRGKLTVAFDDGQLYWQWARLTNIDTPRTVDAKCKWVPCSLQWVTADQVWFKVVVSASEWTWGDGTWTFGDGTAEFGESGTLATLTATGNGSQNFTINHGGNIDATNVAVTITAGTSSITVWRYINATRFEQMNGTQPIGIGESLTIDSGARSAWLKGVPTTITTIGNQTGTTTLVSTAIAHGLTTGDTVQISGTGTFDGIHRNITVSSTTAFNFPSKKYSDFIIVGNVRKLTSYYSNWSANSASWWPVLSPGDNNIKVIITGNATTDATIAWEYYEHFA